MIILDASSSMLNVSDGGDSYAGAAGETSWDIVRDALAGDSSLFDAFFGGGSNVLEDVAQVGLIVFGSEGQERVLLDYTRCAKDNLGWALDPYSSCVGPGCTDPYAGPPIEWTSVNGSNVTPFFDAPTISYMPKCDEFSTLEACTGAATETHIGVELADDNRGVYYAEQSQSGATFPVDDGTLFVNILIVDGSSTGPDLPLQTALEDMFDAGVVTYVIGYGQPSSFSSHLEQMASWGSGGNAAARMATSLGELQARLYDIVADIDFSGTFAPTDCSMTPEP